MTNIPKILVDICSYVSKQNLILTKPFEDGRVNASINEDEVIRLIQKQFSIEVPRSRAWYDFAVETGEQFYPVNIKITDTTHADNLNCKLGIYYALTGLLPDFPNEIKWLSFFEKLKLNLAKEDSKDYYFLVFNKQNPSDVFLNTLKCLTEIQPNGNNLPFQCNWDKNRVPHQRNFDDSATFILTTFGKSIKLRSEIYFNFKKHFPEYV